MVFFHYQNNKTYTTKNSITTVVCSLEHSFLMDISEDFCDYFSDFSATQVLSIVINVKHYIIIFIYCHLLPNTLNSNQRSILVSLARNIIKHIYFPPNTKDKI